jgi:hypothetical protein
VLEGRGFTQAPLVKVIPARRRARKGRRNAPRHHSIEEWGELPQAQCGVRFSRGMNSQQVPQLLTTVLQQRQIQLWLTWHNALNMTSMSNADQVARVGKELSIRNDRLYQTNATHKHSPFATVHSKYGGMQRPQFTRARGVIA